MQLETAPGGHLGVLTGRAARGTTWVLLDRFLAAHDAPPGRRRRPARPEVENLTATLGALLARVLGLAPRDA